MYYSTGDFTDKLDQAKNSSQPFVYVVVFLNHQEATNDPFFVASRTVTLLVQCTMVTSIWVGNAPLSRMLLTNVTVILMATSPAVSSRESCPVRTPPALSLVRLTNRVRPFHRVDIIYCSFTRLILVQLTECCQSCPETTLLGSTASFPRPIPTPPTSAATFRLLVTQ